jgi:hypothetical protein
MANIKTPSENKTPTKTLPGFIISNPTHKPFRNANNNLQLLRITITKNETKVDFGYQATSYYTNGGWIKISPKTFIRPKGSSQKLVLTNATNIPYGPEKLHFNSSIEWRYFSLHFPSLLDLKDSKKSMMFESTSLAVDAIDLIEAENGTENDFNFYDIQLNDETKKSMIY